MNGVRLQLNGLPHHVYETPIAATDAEDHEQENAYLDLVSALSRLSVPVHYDVFKRSLLIEGDDGYLTIQPVGTE